jgi:type VI secretion system protein ImpC
MRRYLHDPGFQSVEASWRALDFLVQRVETGPDLKIYIADVAREDVVGSSGPLKEIILEPGRTPGSEPWSLLVANHTYATVGRDTSPLAFFGELARQAGAPFLAEAELPSAESDQWRALRHAPYAPWLGLVLPRFLLRLPYGKDTSPVESFRFEEMPERPEHTRYLWGNAAMACACLLAQTFNRDGWDMRPGTVRELSGLPLHVYHCDGETHTKPCAEVLMTFDEAEMLLDQGIMPLASLKDQDVVRLVRFQSIAEPLAPLAGRWS